MLPWRRTLPPSSVAAFLVAGACAVGAFVSVDAAAPAGAASLGEPTTVVVAAGDVAAGAALAAADLSTATLPASVVPTGAVTDPAAAEGRTAVTPFVAGEVVTSTRLAAGGGPLTAAVPPGLVAVAIAPDISPDGIGAGDRVDVVATYLTARPYAATVGEDLTVLEVGDAAATTTTLTVLADPFTAAELARADATATLAVAVRGFEPLP